MSKVKRLLLLVSASIVSIGCGDDSNPSANRQIADFPAAGDVETGRWLIDISGSMVSAGSQFVVEDVSTYGCLEDKNPLTSYFDSQVCDFTFEEPITAQVASIQFTYDCEMDDFHDFGGGTLFTESPTLFGAVYQSNLTIGDGSPIESSVVLSGERLSECEQ